MCVCDLDMIHLWLYDCNVMLTNVRCSIGCLSQHLHFIIAHDVLDLTMCHLFYKTTIGEWHSSVNKMMPGSALLFQLHWYCAEPRCARKPLQGILHNCANLADCAFWLGVAIKMELALWQCQKLLKLCPFITKIWNYDYYNTPFLLYIVWHLLAVVLGCHIKSTIDDMIYCWLNIHPFTFDPTFHMLWVKNETS